VFFQQVSITGRVMGKGVVASFFGQVAEKGYQLVYGATANLFTDRYGNYIGFGPEESELAAVADLDTFAVLPWIRGSPGCTAIAMTPRPASFWTPIRGRISRRSRMSSSRSWLSVFDRDRARDDVAAQAGGGRGAPGGHKPYCYHIHQFEELRPVLLDVVEYGQALGLDMSYGDHEDAPGQLELNFRFDRPVRTADNITTYRQVCAAVGRKHDLLPTFMPKPFTGVSANGHHHHFTLVDDQASMSSMTRRAGEAVAVRPALPGRHA